MKKAVRFCALFLMLLLFFALSFSAQKTEYQIGESEGGLLNDGKLKEAFQTAVDRFRDWMYEGVPSGYVTQGDGYYLQPYTDGEDRSAAVYVGSDYRPFVLRGPIFEQLESVGGFASMGGPLSDAYEADGVWYQNFGKGYATVDGDGKVRFVEGKSVDKTGKESPLSTDSVTESGSSDSSGTVTDPVTDSGISSPSQMISDAVDGMEETGSRWGIRILLLLAIPAVLILLLYFLLKRR